MLPHHLTRGEDYQGLRQHVTSSFAAANTPRAAAFELHSRKQRAHESVHEFAMAVAHSAFPHDPALVQQQAADIFCSGLLDKKLAAVLCMQEFSSLAAAERQALRANYPASRLTGGVELEVAGQGKREVQPFQQRAVRTVSAELSISRKQRASSPLNSMPPKQGRHEDIYSQPEEGQRLRRQIDDLTAAL